MSVSDARLFPPGYGPVSVSSDYRPMDRDKPFLAAWRVAREHTLVDQLRLFELWQLVSQLDGVPGDLLEVGVWRGGSAAIIGAALARRGERDRILYLADTFTGVVKAGARDPYYRGGEHGDTDLETVRDFLHNAGLSDFRLLRGVFPEETGNDVAADALSFCHIDVDVYQSAHDVFFWAWPRLSTGGVVVFDDYGFYGCEGVTEFVNTLRRRRDCLVVANVNGHALVIRTQ